MVRLEAPGIGLRSGGAVRMAAIASELDIKAARFTREFNAFVERAAIRWERVAARILTGEGERAARAYESGGAAAAVAAVLPPQWRAYLDRVWLSTVPPAGELVSALLGKAAENVFLDAAVRWLKQNGGARVQGITDTSREEIGNQIRIGVEKGESRVQIAQRIRYHRRA